MSESEEGIQKEPVEESEPEEGADSQNNSPSKYELDKVKIKKSEERNQTNLLDNRARNSKFLAIPYFTRSFIIL